MHIFRICFHVICDVFYSEYVSFESSLGMQIVSKDIIFQRSILVQSSLIYLMNILAQSDVAELS